MNSTYHNLYETNGHTKYACCTIKEIIFLQRCIPDATLKMHSYHVTTYNPIKTLTGEHMLLMWFYSESFNICFCCYSPEGKSV